MRGGGGALLRTSTVFLETFKDLLSRDLISENSYILYVDDGSSDDTWDQIRLLSAKNPFIQGLRLSRNKGHQYALLAGLMEAKNFCDIAISIDCDGQDDINAIEQMISEYKKGYDIVYGVRSNRDSDSMLKRKTAEWFYRFMQLLGAETIFNHADYRLLSRQVLDALAEYTESNLYLRGLIPQIGYAASTVEYTRYERVAGKSHYPFRKMLRLAFDGITSFSTTPLHLIALLGSFFSILGLFGVVWAIASVCIGATVDGWASIVCIVALLSGIQLLCLGVIGEYVGRIYIETKHRPRYIVQERTGFEVEKS